MTTTTLTCPRTGLVFTTAIAGDVQRGPVQIKFTWQPKGQRPRTHEVLMPAHAVADTHVSPMSKYLEDPTHASQPHVWPWIKGAADQLIPKFFPGSPNQADRKIAEDAIRSGLLGACRMLKIEKAALDAKAAAKAKATRSEAARIAKIPPPPGPLDDFSRALADLAKAYSAVRVKKIETDGQGNITRIVDSPAG